MTRLLTLLFLAWAAPVAAAQGGFLGVELDPGAETGARIAQVQEPSAASLMGLQAGDVVLAVGDQPVASSQALAALVAGRLPGEIVTLRVLRGADETELTGLLGRRPGDTQVHRPEAGFLPIPPPSAQAQPPWGQRFPWGAWHGDAENGSLFVWPQLPEGFDAERWQSLQDEMQALRERLDALQWQMPPLDGSWMPRIPYLKGPSVPGPRPDAGQPLFDGFDLTVPHAELPRFQFAVPEGAQREVHLRYPADTPEAERQRLIDEARAKYGDDVTVEFAGTGTSISIRSTVRTDSGDADGQEGLPEVDEDDEV